MRSLGNLKMDPVIVHGVLLSVSGKGILLRGPSGCGKSELAARMLERGHALVADDAVRLTLNNGLVMGSVLAQFRSLLHIRGRGLMNVREEFGESRVREEHTVDLVVELQAPVSASALDGLGIPRHRIDRQRRPLPELLESLANGTLNGPG